MIQYTVSMYEEMFGNIDEAEFESAASCIGQCTGCMCSCKCSCSGGIILDCEWEEL